MMYEMYQAQADIMNPLRMMARTGSALMKNFIPSAPYGIALRHVNAAMEVFGYSGTTHKRPAYAIKDVMVGNKLAEVHETVVLETPFANLIHFSKDSDRPQPKVLLVAPLSGHFATL